LFQDGELGVTGGFDERQPELGRKCIGDVPLRNHAQGHQECAELVAGFLLQPQRTFEAGGIELAALDQDLAKALAIWGMQLEGYVWKWRVQWLMCARRVSLNCQV